MQLSIKTGSEAILFTSIHQYRAKVLNPENFYEPFEWWREEQEIWDQPELGMVRERDMNPLWFMYVLSKVSVRFLYVDLQNTYLK